jgi:hypothetical protein
MSRPITAAELVSLETQRKRFALDQIQESKHKDGFPSLDYYEQRIIEIAGSRIGLLTLATELLERARRADPAYATSRARRRNSGWR